MSRPVIPLCALVLILVGCGEERLRKTLPPDVYVDTYDQQSASKVDVLWVVDNSGSMAPHQENLARSFQSFIDLFTRGAVDYRIAVTTTDTSVDKGQFKGSPRIITPQSGNVGSLFANNIRVGTNGSPFETGLKAAQMALERQAGENAPKLEQIETCKQKCTSAACIQACPGQYPVDFMRPDAYLYLIFVSDDEDKSTPADIRYYWRAFETANSVGNDAMVTPAAIVPTPEDNSCGVNVGTRYLELAQLTGGETGSICQTDFSTTLRRLATNAVGLRRKFALTRKPNVETLEVFVRYPCNVSEDVLGPCANVDRAECEGNAPEAVKLVCTPHKGGTDGWEYEPATNVVFFAGDSVPGLKSQVDLQYYEEGKP
jgi:hypothetical protein